MKTLLGVEDTFRVKDVIANTTRENAKQSVQMLRAAGCSSLVASSLIEFANWGCVKIGIGEIDGVARFYSLPANQTFTLSECDIHQIKHYASLYFGSLPNASEQRSMTVLMSNDLTGITLSLPKSFQRQ